MRYACALAIGAMASTAGADFGIVDQFVLETSSDQAHGITTDGTSWYVAQIFSPAWDVFDQDFNYVSTTTVAAGVEFRGISYCEDSETMFAADYGAGVTRECTLDGAQIDSFSNIPGALNAVTVHRLDNTLWFGTFADGIHHYDKNGNLLGTFDPGFFVTGVAIDEAANTLLIMESNDDAVYEFDFDGNQIGIVVQGLIPDNGQGLYYDAYTATLYATTQTGPSMLTIMHDPDRPTLGAECFADCNGDGDLNVLDFVCFQGEWQGQTDAGDCDGNGLYNILDFVCFQGLFVEGCD